MSTAWMRFVIVAAVAGAALLAQAAPAYAHADYESSTPAKNEVVATAPAQVEVFFTQEITRQQGAYFVRVFNEQEVQVSDGDGVLDDDNRAHITATFQPDLPPGRYIVEWLTTSFEDGDDDEGAFCFYIAVQPTAEQQEACAAFEEDGAAPTPAAGATATSTSPPPTATPAAAETPTAEATPADTPDGDDGSNTGLIVGGIIGGGVIAVIVIGGAAIWLRRTLA